MATLKYLSQYFSTTLNVGGGIDASQTTGIILQSVSGVHDITEPGQICVTYSDPIDTSVAEWIDYTSINGSNELVGAVRGREGFSAHTHLQNATVAFILSASHHNDVVNAVKKVYNETTDTLLKASAAEVVTGTDDTKIVTSLAAAPYANSSMARQAIINGNFDVWQRGTTFGTFNDDTYSADRWIVLSDGNAAWTSGRSTVTPSTKSSYSLYLTNETANKQAGIVQVIEGINTAKLIGQTVNFSFKAKTISGFEISKLRAAVIAWTGTVDAVTSDVVGTWAGNGTDPTLAASWVYENTPSDLTLTTDYQTFSLSAVLDQAGTTNLAVFIWVDDTTITAADSIRISQVQLCAGDVALPFQPKSFEEELRACQRYYWKSFTYAVAPAQNSGSRLGSLGYRAQISSTTAGGSLAVCFPVKMRTNPTITYFNPSAANAKWRNQSIGADSADASSSGSIGDNGFLILNAQVAGDNAGNIIDVHATAEAEL